MASDDQLRSLKRKLEEVLGVENAKTLMGLLIGESRNEMLDWTPEAPAAPHR